MSFCAMSSCVQSVVTLLYEVFIVGPIQGASLSIRFISVVQWLLRDIYFDVSSFVIGVFAYWYQVFLMYIGLLVHLCVQYLFSSSVVYLVWCTVVYSALWNLFHETAVCCK